MSIFPFPLPLFLPKYVFSNEKQENRYRFTDIANFMARFLREFLIKLLHRYFMTQFYTL